MEENIIENTNTSTEDKGQNNNPNKNQTQIAGAILIAGIFIAGAILLKGTPPASPINTGNADKVAPTTTMRPVSGTDHILGNPNAKIVVVEYSDLECPFCKVFHGTMHKVIESNKNIAWVYRHYPIPELHAKATKEAEATECAWEQGGNSAFWKYTDRLFEITKSNDGLDSSELPKIAEYAGLNVASFNTCLQSGKYAGKVDADIEDGNKAGVNGTPSSFILVNGKVVDNIGGAQPYDVVTKKLNAIK